MFDAYSYILFHLFSMLIALIGYTLSKKKQKTSRIPLAGWQAALLAGFLMQEPFIGFPFRCLAEFFL